jgi:hypothetical protein
MFPSIWLWAPHLAFPLSGNVTQDIAPVERLFGQSADPQAGNPKIEQQAFEVASYGQQLGLITELLLELAESSLPNQGEGNRTLQRLKTIQAAIEKLKDTAYSAEVDEMAHKLQTIRRRGGAPAQKLAKSLGEP